MTATPNKILHAGITFGIAVSALDSLDFNRDVAPWAAEIGVDQVQVAQMLTTAKAFLELLWDLEQRHQSARKGAIDVIVQASINSAQEPAQDLTRRSPLLDVIRNSIGTPATRASIERMLKGSKPAGEAAS